MNNRILSITLAGAFLVTALPASAQLLGGASGAVGGTLGAQVLQPGLGGTLGAAGEGRFVTDVPTGALRERADATRGQAVTRARGAKGEVSGAAGTLAGTGLAVAGDGKAVAAGAMESTHSAGGQPAQSSQPALIDGLAASTSADGGVEREAAGRRVSARGNSRQSIARGAEGLALGSSSDAEASMTRVEEPTPEAPAEE